MGWYDVGLNNAAGTTRGTASGSCTATSSCGVVIMGLFTCGLCVLSSSPSSLVSSPPSVVGTGLGLLTDVSGTLLTKFIISSYRKQVYKRKDMAVG